MHPEVEKLIDLALADGQITEKERNVILKKAAELGVDADEVEMTLDGKFHQLEASKPKQKEKVGNIKTCPACGNEVGSFVSKCICGHEFVNIKTVNFTVEISNKFDEIDMLEIENNEKNERKKNVIENIPISNSKEDLLELLSISTSKGIHVDIDNPTYGAWRSKAREAIIKLEIIFPNDKSVTDLINKSKKQIKFAGIRNSILWFVVALIVVILYFAIFKKALE